MNNKLIAAARGDHPLDLAINNIQLVNVFTGEIYPAAIGIADGTIVHVTAPGETELDAVASIDGQGKFAVPGLIDTHLHIESSMLTPAHYAETVLPHGTTLIVTDPHEIGNILGEEGVRYMVDASKVLDLRVMTLAPSCVPSAPAVETAGAEFTPEVIERMLTWDGIDGVAEVMNYHGVIHEDPRMMGILEANKRAGKIPQGHAPTVVGRDLSAYLVAGPDSDHECRTMEEAIAKLRAGMIVDIRESSFSLNMAEVAKAIVGKGYLPNVTLCTDDVLASDLIERGHINHVVVRAIEEGIPAVDAIRYATLNAANRLNRKDIGAIAPGRLADIVLVDELESMNVSDVFIGGKTIVKEGKLTERQQHLEPPQEYLQTVHLPEIHEDDLHLHVEDPNASEARVRVIEYDFAPGLPTGFIETVLPVKDGQLVPESYDGHKGPLNRVAVWHRHGLNDNKALGLLAGFGIIAGAVATTVAHDSHHLTVLGVNTEDMVIAANELRKRHGGMIAVKDGEVIAFLPLPLAGIMSLEEGETFAPKIKEFIDIIQAEIMPGKNPIHRMIVVTLPVIPQAKITDLGLVDVDKQQLVPLIIETK
ncbi:adenine deaminase [Paenibacillus dokdonensis]|uniref:Adenine deaminase n=1 Tax=Paenibacillus dokdonensis TaxID=2567944 RepID=A0ABU6GQP4_9BACL|nr:adenine deaminase [Paenibacillus dokdonensis]MEC0242089.1 adenine deaminase [Paenibacillus dokdonensis]